MVAKDTKKPRANRMKWIAHKRLNRLEKSVEWNHFDGCKYISDVRFVVNSIHHKSFVWTFLDVQIGGFVY